MSFDDKIPLYCYSFHITFYWRSIMNLIREERKYKNIEKYISLTQANLASVHETFYNPFSSENIFSYTMKDKGYNQLVRIEVKFDRDNKTVDIKSNNFYGHCRLYATEDDFLKKFYYITINDLLERITMIDLDDTLEHYIKYTKDNDGSFNFNLISDPMTRDYIFDYLIEIRFVLVQGSILFNHITTAITQP